MTLYRIFEDESTRDLQRAEDALRENEDRYRTFFDLAPVAGLSGMRGRVADLGGSFDIESDLHGTAIIVTFPLAAQPSGKSRASQENLGKNSAA